MDALLTDGKDNAAVVACAVDRGMNADFLRGGTADQITAGGDVRCHNTVSFGERETYEGEYQV